MNIDPSKILKSIGVSSFRTKNIVKHIMLSFIYKGGAVISSFLLVPLTINYLGTENYGVWLTISSFVSWFTFFDVGLGNGLRNKFAEAKARGDLTIAKAYVSSAYYTIASISLLLFLVFFICNGFINWTSVFNTSTELSRDLLVLMPIVVGFFCLQLITKLITSIYLADQNHSIQVKVHFFTQILSLAIIWLLTTTSGSSLVVYGIIFSSVPVVILISLNVFAFSGKFKNFKPEFNLWKSSHVKDIMGLGINFFLIQIAGVILFSTDNFIISKLFGPEQVVPYNVAFKYFSIITMAFTIVVAPYWSSFTEAYIKDEFQWIKKSIKNIMTLWVLIPIALIIMVFISNWFYKLWVGEDIVVPRVLSINMAVFILLYTFNMIFVFFINGVGKIKIQLIISVISMIINIPLSIFFAKTLDLGLSGVILATTISVSASAILSPIQYFKIINFKAKGIWNQ